MTCIVDYFAAELTNLRGTLAASGTCIIASSNLQPCQSHVYVAALFWNGRTSDDNV